MGGSALGSRNENATVQSSTSVQEEHKNHLGLRLIWPQSTSHEEAAYDIKLDYTNTGHATRLTDQTKQYYFRTWNWGFFEGHMDYE